MEGNILLPLVVLLPFLGFVLLGLFGKRIGEPVSGWIATATVLSAFGLGVSLLMGGGAKWQIENWLPGVQLSLSLDQLSGLMVMVVAGIGSLIHMYAIGYMHGDPGFSRFFGYFNLFIAAMLILVLGDSLPVVFIGWEGVGVASYLLIGFWYTDRVNVDSARKAFIVNRIGDLGFLLGMGLLWQMFGTLSISELRHHLETPGGYSPALMTMAAFFLFIGAMGKSAQVPLMVWLPDAMAGPTPVSALIHAATMVTAGVYLVVRHHFIYELAPSVSDFITWIGAITAVYGALCAFGQRDIKRIVAYSTLSQLGFMFVAAGVGAYWVAMFHVMTHAFFKALLFMSSGSVIHALGGEQDVAKMGGMWKYLPQTRWHALIGTLALGGLVPFAGFWSKDAILSNAYERSPILWAVMIAVAVMTALYSMRWFVLVFLGSYRGKEHPHESPAIMTFPNHILTIGSVVSGFVGLPFVLQEKNILEQFLAPALHSAHAEHHHPAASLEWTLIAVSAVLAVAALYSGWKVIKWDKVPQWFAQFQAHSLQSFYADNIYNKVIVNPLKGLASFLLDADDGLLTGFVGLGKATGGMGGMLAKLQTGFLRYYAAVIVLAVAAIVIWSALRGGQN